MFNNQFAGGAEHIESEIALKPEQDGSKHNYNLEHIESEIALKPELRMCANVREKRAYRIGDRAQAGTRSDTVPPPCGSISNRRSRSSRNTGQLDPTAPDEHIESEIALKPERGGDS